MDLQHRVAHLENQVAHELEMIAGRMQNVYKKFIPIVDKRRYDTANLLNELSDTMDTKMAEINQMMDGMNIGVTAEEVSILQGRVKNLSVSRNFVHSVEEIERNLANLSVQEYSELFRAKIIKETELSLKECIEEARALGISESILSSLCGDLTRKREYRCYFLGEFFKKAVMFPDEQIKDRYRMQIHIRDVSKDTEYFGAMEQLDILDPRLTKWAKFIVEMMCGPIVSSGNGENCYQKYEERSEPNCFTFKVRGPLKSDRRGGNINAVAIFETLGKFFTELSLVLRDVTVGSADRELSLKLGKKMEKPLMDMLLKDLVSVCVPASCKQDDPIVKSVMGAAEEFRSTLINVQFFNEASPTFGEFAEANERVFIDRRCLSILTDARDLIMMPYLDLVTVGSGGEIDEELLSDFVNAFGQNMSADVRFLDTSYPRLLRLLQCRVSATTVKIVELIESTLQDAVNNDNELVSARLALTIRNVVQLFVLTAPRHHHSSISSVPEQAAVFFNNCFFLAHRIMMLPFNVLKGATNTQMEHFRPLLTDNVFRLREIAADALEVVLAQCRRNLSAELVDSQLFADQRDVKKSRDVKKALRRCTDLIERVSSVFKEVMTETVYGKSIGNLSTYLLTELGNLVLGMEDIASKDAEDSALLLENVLKILESLFMINGHSSIHKMCETAYFRTKEIIYCLNGSLQGIDDRWCTGKGPLAEWLSAAEVRKLVKALFANTDQRKRLLDRIF